MNGQVCYDGHKYLKEKGKEGVTGRNPSKNIHNDHSLILGGTRNFPTYTGEGVRGHDTTWNLCRSMNLCFGHGPREYVKVCLSRTGSDV